MVEDTELRAVALGATGVSPVEHIVRALHELPGVSLIVSCVGAPDLAPRLRAATAVPVVEVADSVHLEDEHIYIVPADRDVRFSDGSMIVEPTRGPAPLDRLFRGLGESFGHNSLAVVLAGRGTEGTLGLKRVKEVEGLTICEAAPGEEATSSTNAEIADLTLPLDEIPARVVAFGRAVGAEPVAEHAPAVADQRQSGELLRDILSLVRVRTGHDFSSYKRATLFRRIARRMQVSQTTTLQDYDRYLRDHPQELPWLMRDFLISVTSFFRDPESFDLLASEVIPKLFAGKTANDHVRVWVAGCATGEEAYSIGMLLLEHAGRLTDKPRLQIFATDIDERALAEARTGRYPESIAADVSVERLGKFFTHEAGYYRVSEALRAIVLFSSHNVLRDPPFSRLDLVSCRNLLIYLEREAQDRVLNVFHFGLSFDGFLFLGSSESAESTAKKFVPLDPKQTVFTRRPIPSATDVESLMKGRRFHEEPRVAEPAGTARDIASYGELHHRIVEHYAPPSVLVDEELQVLHLSEHAGRFFEPAGGTPTRELLRLVHPALRFELRSAIYAARQQMRTTEARVVRFDDGNRERIVELRVRAVDLPELGNGTLLVMFDELDKAPRPERTCSDPRIDPVVREMEEELKRTHDQLRITIEQYETSVQDLKATNEELNAINEELRSTTEEHETSKEELQSVNEELATLNYELKDKVDEISRASNDLQNLMSSTDIGVLFLDRSLSIKRFTPRAQTLFNLIPSDLGRPLVHVTHKLLVDDLPETASQVLKTGRTIKREVKTRDSQLYLASILPYRSLEDRIEGVVLTFVDITDLKAAQDARVRSEAALRTSEERLHAALRFAPVVVITQDEHHKTSWAYVLGRDLGTDPEAVLALFMPASAQRFQEITHAIAAGGASQRAELELVIDGATRTYDFRMEPSQLDGQINGVISVGFDITPSKLAEIELRDADRRKNEFIATLSHELRNPLTPLRVAFDVVARITEGSPEPIEQSMSIMGRQIDVLIRLVEDLLDLSRITQGKIQLHLQQLELPRLVDAVLEATRPTIDEACHELHVKMPASPVTLFGDLTRLTQVFVNLLSNAAKYTAPGGQIEFELARDEDRKLLVARVHDTGIGIPGELLPRVFDIFVQSRDEHDRSKGGLGIGLNLVRRIVELHGGKVSAHSDGPGTGSTFIVELPLATPEA